MALRQGMSGEKISNLLTGSGDFIKPEKAKAIMFARHFAGSSGFPTRSSYDAIVKEYGQKAAGIILSAVQISIAGIVYGDA